MSGPKQAAFVVANNGLQDISTRNTAIQNSTKAVHNETVQIVDAQLKNVALQMTALDEFVTRARRQNGRHHDSRCESLAELGAKVRGTLEKFGDTFQSTSTCLDNHHTASQERIVSLQSSLSPLSQSIRAPLRELEANLESNAPVEYVASGETPQKKDWTYPASLPRTESHEMLLNKLRGVSSTRSDAAPSPRKLLSPRKLGSPRKGSSPSKLPSPSRTRVFVDSCSDSMHSCTQPPSNYLTVLESKTGLREVDMNVLAHQQPAPSSAEGHVGIDGGGHSHPPQPSFSRSTNMAHQQPPLKRHATADCRLPRKGRENNLLGSQSVGPRPGPGVMARRLRSSPQE